VATAKTGYLFRLLEVDVLGFPEADITRSSVSFVVSGDTVITPQFIVNPYPALAGQWSGLISDGWTSGLVTVTVNASGGYTMRVQSGRNSFSSSGVLGVGGRVQVNVPAAFWPYSETKNASNQTNSTALNPTTATLSLEGGRLKFVWGSGDPSALSYGSATLDKSNGATLVSALPSRRYNSALWKYADTSRTSWDQHAGFCTADMTTTGLGVFLGTVRVGDKTVRYSFSGNLVAGPAADAPVSGSTVSTTDPYTGYPYTGTYPGTTYPGPYTYPLTTPTTPVVIVDPKEAIDYVAKGGARLNFYAVAASSELVVHGSVGLNGTQLRGPLSTRYVRTGTSDPLAGTSTSAASTYEVDYRVNGYPYVAPKSGMVALPFVQPGTLSFGVSAGTAPMGRLSLVSFRPVFQYTGGASSGGVSLAAQSASLSTLLTNGGFSGSVTTTGSVNGTAAVATRVTRGFSGVLLQGGTQSAVGITTDGLPIKFQ
jgi:hypothetical protein